ncbi:hypothetical protein VTO73DRAFT_15585 [Trametes versicolor]
MHSFSLVLLRCLLFRSPSPNPFALYDQLSAPAIATLERILLHSLLHEPAPVVRHKTVDTSQVFAMADNTDVHTREAAFRVFAGCPNLIMDLQTDAIFAILQKGLQDQQRTEVRLASLHASVAFLSALNLAQQAQALSLMYPMLNTLPSLPHVRLPPFLLVFTELTASNPHLFRPHIPALLVFLPSLLLPVVDAGPTRTVARPNPGGGSSFALPPAPHDENGDDKAVSREDDEVRKGTLEFMMTLSEARPNMLRRVEGWMNIVCTMRIPASRASSRNRAEIAQSLRDSPWVQCLSGHTPPSFRDVVSVQTRLSSPNIAESWVGASGGASVRGQLNANASLPGRNVESEGSTRIAR